MIQMEGDRDLPYPFFSCLPLHHLHRSASHVAQKRPVRIVPRPLRHLEDDGRLGFQAGHDDRLELFHIVEIVSRNGKSAPAWPRQTWALY